MKHNNQLPNQHFRKHWQRRVKTWFNQPAKKIARQRSRTLKALRLAPRPLSQFLRPAVRCTTIRYNRRLRLGRGFSLEELRAAGIHPKQAATVGIAVDHRRKNRSEESMTRNVQRLEAYKAKLLVLPKKAKSLKDVNVTHAQLLKTRNINQVYALPKVTPLIARPITDAERSFKAFVALRQAKVSAKYRDVNASRAKRKGQVLPTEVKK